MQETLIWLNDKTTNYWLAPFYGLSIGLNPFFSEWIWYIIFIAVWCLIFFSENKKYAYNHLEKTMAGIGLGIGLILLLFFSYLDNHLKSTFIDKNSNHIYIQKSDNKSIDKIILNNKDVFPNKEKKMFAYAVTPAEEKKLDLQTMDLNKWILSDSEKYQKINMDELYKPYELLGNTVINHIKITTMLFITLIIILAHWNKKVFKRITPWIIGTLFLELLTVGIGFMDTSIFGVVNSLYTVKKIQQIVSVLAITTILLFIGITSVFT